MKLKKISWSEFESLSDSLAKKIRSSKIDVIVCISRGGLVLGRILSDRLNKPLGVISVRAYKNCTLKQAKEIILDKKVSLIEELHGNILLVDDVADSGKTMALVSNFLKKTKKVNSIKTAVLIKKTTGRIEPDFFAKNSNDWIVFPYEKNEFKKCAGK